MPTLTPPRWTPHDYCLHATAPNAAMIDRVYSRVCRGSFDAPGFAMLDLGTSIASIELRRFMVDLKHGLQ